MIGEEREKERGRQAGEAVGVQSICTVRTVSSVFLILWYSPYTYPAVCFEKVELGSRFGAQPATYY